MFPCLHQRCRPVGGCAGHRRPGFRDGVGLHRLGRASDAGTRGSFKDRPDGSLQYVSCGSEPRLHVGSRRGVPYLSKIRGSLRGLPGDGMHYLTRPAVDLLRLQHGSLDFRAHLWPLIAKESAHSYYRELFTAYPQRTALPWDEFSSRFESLDWYSAEREALLLLAVPESRDRLDFETLDNPLASRDFNGPEQIHR